MNHLKRFALALGLALITSTAFAQVPGYPSGCKDCVVYSWVDTPSDGDTVEASNLTFEGWGFECFSGQVINRVDVFYQDYDGFYRPLKQGDWTLTTGLPRQDVQDAYSGHCRNVSTYTGWRLTLNNPPPPGLRRIAINIWRGPLFETHHRLYLIK